MGPVLFDQTIGVTVGVALATGVRQRCRGTTVFRHSDRSAKTRYARIMPVAPFPTIALAQVFGPSAKMHRATVVTSVDGKIGRKVVHDVLRHPQRKLRAAAARVRTPDGGPSPGGLS